MKVETLARMAALFEANGRKVPLPLLDVLRCAAEQVGLSASPKLRTRVSRALDGAA